MYRVEERAELSQRVQQFVRLAWRAQMRHADDGAGLTAQLRRDLGDGRGPPSERGLRPPGIKTTPVTLLASMPTPAVGAVADLAIRALLRQRLRQPVALVLDVDGDLGERLGVLAAVMRAEKQFP
jgi:hypothetical protein